MEKCKSVFIADANGDFSSYLREELDRQSDLCVAGVSDNGVETVHQIEILRPDVLLIDVVLHKLDGIGVLRNLSRKSLPHEPMIVVMSYFVTETLEGHAASLGANYYLIKPFEIGNLLELLRYQAKTAQRTQVMDDTEFKISELLRDMGVPSHIKGFHYTREAITLTLNLPSTRCGVTNFIYPQVAKKFSTTPSRVERAIRSAIEVAWRRGDIGVQYDLFRNSVSGERGKPTNSEFIATLADNLLVQNYPRGA
ncbi:MAG: sporulation transcription factor Spo0A [Ruminococcaceae bacterium]|nr:sporulation transcription factor Spo0A [Oscillospiraceae bacterium]